jgi:hypothetical protein
MKKLKPSKEMINNMNNGSLIKRKKLTKLTRKLKRYRKPTKLYGKIIELKMMLTGNKNIKLTFYNGNIV